MMLQSVAVSSVLSDQVGVSTPKKEGKKRASRCNECKRPCNKLNLPLPHGSWVNDRPRQRHGQAHLKAFIIISKRKHVDISETHLRPALSTPYFVKPAPVNVDSDADWRVN